MLFEILTFLDFSDRDKLREAISAGDLVAVVGSGQVRDMGGTSLHVSSNAVPWVVVASSRDWLWGEEFSLESIAVCVHGIIEPVRKL